MKSSALFSAFTFATMAVRVPLVIRPGFGRDATTDEVDAEVRKHMVRPHRGWPCIIIISVIVGQEPIHDSWRWNAFGRGLLFLCWFTCPCDRVLRPLEGGRVTNMGVLVNGIVANVATGGPTRAGRSGSFKAVFALTAAIYLSAFEAFGFVRDRPRARRGRSSFQRETESAVPRGCSACHRHVTT